MEGFENNLKELRNVYSKCLTDFEVTFALYPHNEILAKLTKDYAHFFKWFGESRPISKNLSSGNIVKIARKNSWPEEDATYVPSYLSGLSQVVPKNLGIDIECK